MAVMGLRLAQRANGVSVLHGAVSREMFGGLWPGFDSPEVPITSVTNGVHAETWVHPAVFELAERELGPDALVDEPFAAVDRLSDKAIWEIRTPAARANWSARPGAGSRSPGSPAAPPPPSWAGPTSLLDPDVLTIGFARRVPSYKRLTLMLRDRERLISLLPHPDRPVQLVDRGQGAPGRRRRQAAGAGTGALRRRRRGCGTASPSCRTTTWRWRRPCCPAATCG